MRKLPVVLIFLVSLVLLSSFILALLVENFTSIFLKPVSNLGVGLYGSEGTSTPVILTCNRTELYINWTNNCTVTGCNQGWWEIRNLENNPLEEHIIRQINISTENTLSINFTVKKVGKIITKVICNDPDFSVNHTTEVLRGPYIDCPEICSVGEECECSVNQCSQGLFLLDNNEFNPLSKNIIEDINDISFNYTFKPYREGKVEARMWCKEPYFEHQIKYIAISKPGKQFYMSNVSCNGIQCSIDVYKNTIGKETSILVQVFEEPQGIICYTGNINVPSSQTGEKNVTLNKVKDCLNVTDLKILAIASTSRERIDRLKHNYTRR
jgi:hypothetical protein